MKIRKKWITAYLLAFCLLLSCFLFTPAPVYADSQKEFSSVLTDLQKDTTFKIEDYPVSAEDYSLQVIQIAESTDNELFVYVYQPSAVFGSLVASSINVALGDTNFTNYTLTLCNSHETLYKYLIDDLAVSTDSVREYEITSIYRPFNAAIDTNANNGNTITEVNYPVAKKWIFTTTETGTSIYCHDIETIEITDKYVGFARVKIQDGFGISDWVDRHFVAFSTDKTIDKLVQADVWYTSQFCMIDWTIPPATAKYGDKQDNQVTVNADSKVQVGSGTGGFLFWQKYTYTWDEIQTVSEFVDSVEVDNMYSIGLFDVMTESKITDDGLGELYNQQWVLNFATTEFNDDALVSMRSKVIVGDVSILRLQFETDGVLYNIGIIDNKQTGSDEPINNWTSSYDLNIVLKIILGIIFAVLLIRVITWIVEAFKGNTKYVVKKNTHKKKNTRKKGRRK